MRIVSWNINGLRAGLRKGFMAWLARSGAQVVGLQEVRARAEDLPPELLVHPRWRTHFVAAARRGYSGVGLFARSAPDRVDVLGVPRFDVEGRVQIARFGALWVVNAYFPKGSGPGRDNSRIPYKLAFYRRLLQQLTPALQAGERVIAMGDFNTAHQEIDLARPKQNVLNSGFRPEERRAFDRWLRAGFVDTFRHLHPTKVQYSWWANRLGARERNLGWRIDYVLASPAVMPFLRKAFISDQVLGSDHCPVGVDLDDAVVR